MKKAHAMPFSKDIVFVDSSSFCDQSSSCVTFLFGLSKFGSTPLAFIIHKYLTKESYVKAFFYFENVWVKLESCAERQALKHYCSPNPHYYFMHEIFMYGKHFAEAVWIMGNKTLNKSI